MRAGILAAFRCRAILFVVLITLGGAATASDYSATPSDEQIANLSAFARLYGYLRYFHPSDEAAALDWDAFAVHGAEAVSDAPDSEGLRRQLLDLSQPIAPTVIIYPESAPPPPAHPDLIPSETAGLDLVYWQHLGVKLDMPGIYRSERINRQSKGSEDEAFGMIAQLIDAKPLQGQQIRLRGQVKSVVEGSGNQAQLWLRVDLPEQELGFFDNMQDRPITNDQWQEYAIVGRVDENASKIVFGGLLMGTGDAWFDDLLLESRKNEQEPWTPVAITNGSFETESDSQAIPGWMTGQPTYAYAVSETSSSQHAARISRITESAGKLFDTTVSVGDIYQGKLDRQLRVAIPLALYANDKSTLPAPDASAYERLQRQLNQAASDDASLTRHQRIAGVIIAWNVFQHFYPYFDVVPVDWDEILNSSLKAAWTAQSKDEYLAVLEHMVVALQDGHGYVYTSDNREDGYLPASVDWVEGQVVVTTVTPSHAPDCMRAGDIVVSIDEQDAADRYQSIVSRSSGSIRWRRVRANTLFGEGPLDQPTHLTLSRDGETVRCESKRAESHPQDYGRPTQIATLADGLMYVDLTRASLDEIEAELDHIAKATGVIFDMRGYPNRNHEVLGHLTDEIMQTPRWQIPAQVAPDRTAMAFQTRGWPIQPREPRITAPTVFLIDGNAVSYSETLLSFVDHYQLGTLIGEATAGANGNVNGFEVPGGITIRFTGMRVQDHQGGQHHVLGIQPDIRVARSIKSVRNQQDVFLKAAIEHMRGRLARSKN